MPGTSSTQSVTFVAPSDASVTASIAGGGPLIAIQSVTATKYVWRDANPQEQAQRPPLFGPGGKNPPVTRILVPEELGRTDGSTPLATPSGATVQVTVTVMLPADQAVGIATAMLNISSSAWDPIGVPITVISGPANTPVTVAPSLIQVAAKPGESVLSGVMIDGAPVAAQVVVHLARTDPIIRIDAVLYFPETRPATPEELAQMPLSQRAQAAKNGITQYREIGRSDGSTPLNIPQKARLTVNLTFTAPAVQPPDTDFNTLVIEGTTWQRVQVPLTLSIGQVTATVSPGSIFIAQGSSDTIQVALASITGPDTDVSFSLDQRGFGTLTPALVNLARGASIAQNLRLAVDPGAPLGTYPVGLDVFTFGGTQLQMVPFGLTVVSGAIFVTPLQTAFTANQGDTVSVAVQVVSAGGYKKLTFKGGTLPNGVTLISPVWENYGAASTVQTLQLVVDADADYEDAALASINWSAGDGAHTGRMDLSLTVNLRPDSRTFTANIETPDGTALGGNLELIIRNDGTTNFKGRMHDSGALSYKFSVRALVISADGKVGAVAQESGEVEGTEVIFNPQRTYTWDEPAPANDFAKSLWKSIRTANLSVSKSYEIAGVVGTLADLVADVVDFIAGILLTAVVPGGAALACLVMIGSELGKLYGVRVVGPGGLVGVIAAAGAVFLVGPTMVIPAFVAGVLAADLLIKHRPLNDAEKILARSVFGEQVPYDQVIVTNIAASSGTKFTVPNIDNTILLNMDDDGYNSSLDQYTYKGYKVPGEVFIHEMTHAWQITHAPFIHDVFWKAASAKITGSSAYQYGPPGPDWHRFGLEAQASIVNEWFSGNPTNDTSGLPRSGARMDKNDPYYTYIANNILLGVW